MDRNSIIGLVIIVAILMFWSTLMKPSKEQRAAIQRRQDSITHVQQLEFAKQQVKDTLKTNTGNHVIDSIRSKQIKGKYGLFATSIKDTNEFFTLENNLLKLKLSAKGGRPYSVELKQYTRYDSLPVVLFRGDSTKFGLSFIFSDSISTNDMFFNALSTKKQIIVKNSPDSLALRLYAKENSYIEYVYSMKPNDYMVRFTINFVNMDTIIPRNTSTLDLTWSM
jgi:YidC/Oxa1 family membrane protein insertase